GTPNPKWRYAKANIRLHLVNFLIKFFYEYIDVLAAPIPNAYHSMLLNIPVVSNRVREWNGLPAGISHYIRIKIIIQMYPIYIIPPNNIRNNLDGILPCSFNSGIDPVVISVFNNPLRMFIDDMGWRKFRCFTRVACAKRIKPGMKFDPSFMSLLNSKTKRIVIRFGSFSLFSG